MDKVPAGKPQHLRETPGTHVVEGEKWLPHTPLWHTAFYWQCSPLGKYGWGVGNLFFTRPFVKEQSRTSSTCSFSSQERLLPAGKLSIRTENINTLERNQQETLNLKGTQEQGEEEQLRKSRSLQETVRWPEGLMIPKSKKREKPFKLQMLALKIIPSQAGDMTQQWRAHWLVSQRTWLWFPASAWVSHNGL